MQTLDQQISDCIRHSIVDSCQPLKIMIFGSYATGNATSESDVDIIAVVGNDQQVGSDEIVKVRLAIRRGLKALGKNMAFDLMLSKQAVFEKAKTQIGTIQYVANQQGIVIHPIFWRQAEMPAQLTCFPPGDLTMQWSEVIQDPTLRNLPCKIELNKLGKIEMSPASNHRAIQQARLVRLLSTTFFNGEIASGCSVATRLGVKVTDVVWMSPEFLKEHEKQTPYSQAPELCIEIPPPSNSDVETQEKIALYLEHGAQEVWIVAEDNSISMYGEDGRRNVSSFVKVEGTPSISTPSKAKVHTRERE